MKTGCLLAILLIAAPVAAQDRAAVSLFLAGAITDDVTTWRNVNAGHAETNPVYAFTQHQPTGVVLSLAATDALTLWLAHRYATRHPKLVAGILIGLSGVRFTQAGRNAHAWYLDTHRPFDLGSH